MQSTRKMPEDAPSSENCYLERACLCAALWAVLVLGYAEPAPCKPPNQRRAHSACGQ